jgi:hypothetical protein
MRNQILSGLIAFLVASLLGGCAGTATKPEAATAPTHVDVTYRQFVLSSDGKAPYDLTSLGRVAGECGASSAPSAPRAGGVAILATILASLVGNVASAVESDLQRWVNAQVARYSSDIAGEPTRVGFYSPDLWFRKGDGSPTRYSCFLVVLSKCPTSSIDKDTKTCPNAPETQAQVLIVGQYKLTRESLQVRPLYGRVRGFEAERNEGEKEAGIAATLKFESVWWDGHEGHIEAPLTLKVLSMKFHPTPGGNQDPGTDLAVMRRISPGRYAFAGWDTVPLLPRPPRSPGSYGTVTVTPDLAETNSPPEGLRLLKKVLGENSSQISDALKSALQSLCGKACAPQTGASK